MELHIIKPKTACGCLICPNCGQHEVNCEEADIVKKRFYIRAFKVDNDSHCLNCGAWFNLKGNYVLSEKFEGLKPFANLTETNRISQIEFQKDWDKLHYQQKEKVNKILYELGD